MSRLYITHGFTGSGKSTFAKQYCAENKIIRIAHDEIMIDLFGNNPPQENFKQMYDSVTRVMENITNTILQTNQEVFLDIAGFKKSERDMWKAIADKNNAEFIIFHIKVSKETALKRTLKRTAEKQKDTFYINEKGFDIINSRLEPLEDEEFRIIVDADNS